MWWCHSAVIVSQLGWKQGAGVVCHPAFVSEGLGVCSWTVNQLGWPQRDKPSVSITSQLK